VIEQRCLRALIRIFFLQGVVDALFEIRKGLVEHAILRIDGLPDGRALIRCVGLFVLEQVDEDVVLLFDVTILPVLILNTPLLVILWTVDLLLLLSFHAAAKNVLCERLRELVRVDSRDSFKGIFFSLLASFCLPELRHFLLVAFTHSTLVVVAEALLGPEGALTLQIDLVSSEERCMLQSLHNGRDPMVQIFQLLYRCTGSIQVTLTDLSSTLGCHKRLREVFLKELAAV